MSGSNRNAPCPCGSGKKYKRCCGMAAVVALPAWSASERQQLIEMLTSMAADPGFAGAYGAAHRRFFGPTLKVATPEQTEDIFEHDQADAAFTTYLLYDAYITADKHRLVEMLLDGEMRRTFTPGQVRYLERMAASCMRPYGVRALRLDEGLVLRDLWSSGEVEVKERALTHYVQVGSSFFTRVIEGPGGAPEIFGAVLELGPAAMEDLLASLRASLRAQRRSRPQLDETTFFKEAMPRVAQAWLARFLWTMPDLVTSDGQPMSVQDLFFDVLDRGALEAALAGSGEFDSDDNGQYVWLGPAASKSGLANTLLGSLEIEGRRLKAFVMSEDRAQHLRELLERLAPGALRYRVSNRHDVAGDLAARRSDARPREAHKPAPTAEEAAAVGALLGSYYERWLDDEIPALAGRTPRQAARLKTQRSKVAALLREIEMMGNPGGGALDLSSLWKELDLLDLR